MEIETKAQEGLPIFERFRNEFHVIQDYASYLVLWRPKHKIALCSCKKQNETLESRLRRNDKPGLNYPDDVSMDCVHVQTVIKYMDQFGGCDNYKKRKPGSELQFYKWIVKNAGPDVISAKSSLRLIAHSLTRGKKLNHPSVVELAKKYGKTPAQVMIRWSLHHM